MAQAQVFGHPTTFRPGDTPRMIEAKILNALGGGTSGGGSTAPNYTGTGSPEGVVTALPGSTYQQIDNGVYIRQWVKGSGSGNTGWTA